ncbi:MAG: carboxypeptidase regulatory-like domain-containing protein [Burkholderiaceae bacterium]
MKKSIRMSAVSFASMLAAGLALQAEASTTPLPAEQTQGSVAYVSGGVSQGEATRFKAAFEKYPLVVKLFEHAPDGARDLYTAEADVKIVDPKGTVLLDRKADGPFMLVRLPAGDYRVSASLNGHRMAPHAVHVADGGHADTVFVFPAHTG